MIKLFDRVKVNIPTTGTGDIEFGAAVSTAYLTPAEAGVLDGDEARYIINDGLDFEKGVGLIKDTVATMERTVTQSKIGGVVGTSPINLSGTAVLALTASAADIGNMKGANNLSDLTDADAALDNLGGTSVGKAVFTALNEAAALAAVPSAYHKGNVLGAVSQSGGVPTGAIIERGSNANGEYIRWADGTQICTRTIAPDSIARTASVGALFASAAQGAYFAAAFVATPSVVVTPVSDEGIWAGVYAVADNSVNWYLLDVASRYSDVSVSIYSVGRWF